MRKTYDEIRADLDALDKEEKKDLAETNKAIKAAAAVVTKAEEPKTYSDYRVSFKVDGEEVVFEQKGGLTLGDLQQLAHATPGTVMNKLKSASQPVTQNRKKRKALQREYAVRQAQRNRRRVRLLNEIEKLAEAI